jgi:D-galactarolactone isomerase
MTTRPLTGEPPRLKAPAGACDTHMHFYDSRFHAGLPGTPLPADASVEDYRQVTRWLGIERTVIVQPNAYGDNNRFTMDCVAALGSATTRAVVVVKPDVTDEQLDTLHKAGARGARIMALHGGTVGLDQLDAVAARIHPFGWHPIVQIDGRNFPDHEAQLLALPGNFVIDHVGKFLEPVTPDHPSFRSLLRLVESGRCYVKISGPYETSKTGGPAYEDVGALARELIRAAPERMLWASNWPHAQAAKYGYPNDAALLDLLLDWAPDEATIHKILVDNPARLYGF